MSFSADGSGVVAHAGAVSLRMLADRVGLTAGLSSALTRRGFTAGHDRGRVLVDVAMMIAAGGESIADIDTLRHQDQVLGPVASPPTVWRALDELTPTRLRRLERARARARAHVWGLLPDGRPPATSVAGLSLEPDLVVLDVDATLVQAHSEKEGATGTRKKTFGFHPIGVWCDNTTELLAMTLRPGNAGSNTVADHVQVLTAAIAQLPSANRKRLLVRVDGAGRCTVPCVRSRGRRRPALRSGSPSSMTFRLSCGSACTLSRRCGRARSWSLPTWFSRSFTGI